VLDIAGGQGELSFEMVNLNGFPCTVIDPRPLNVFHFKKRLLYGFYHTPVQKAYVDRPRVKTEEQVLLPNHFRLFFKPSLWNTLGIGQECNSTTGHYDSKKIQFIKEAEDLAKTISWTQKGLVDATTQNLYRTVEQFQANETKDNNGNNDEEEDEEHHQQDTADVKEEIPSVGWDHVKGVLLSSAIVVGMHPDQATEWIVEFAIQTGKPFAVVPCCTYHLEFPHRRLPNGSPIKKYEDLIQYLVAKHPEKIGVQTLPFEGKNRVVYWKPNNT